MTAMGYLVRTLTALLALVAAAMPQTADVAQIERRGDLAVLSVNTFRPLDAIASRLGSQFGLMVSAEDPLFQFRGDMTDISLEVPHVRPGTLVPARWGFEVRFPVNADGSPKNPHDLLASIVAAANLRSPFAYRLDEAGGAFFFVPTRTRDAQGRSIAIAPLLDRLVTIPPGVRRINESAALMAADLSRQTALRVSCCQSAIAGYPWGMGEVMFAANQEPARSILRRLGLNHWHVRCDESFCFIDMRQPAPGSQ
ncbi:MAG TPA: hypothetical protein VKX45_06255 [Bryobacteraceae bacterium]|jgi:hypothetical protein|nr:hypothetical protein [Bryobacteraceae bacterium]